MKISFAGFQLTDWSDSPAMDVRKTNQTVFDSAAVLKPEIVLINPGIDYTVADELDLSFGLQSATIIVTAIDDAGGVSGFGITSNTFSLPHALLSATGGTGSGAVFNVLPYKKFYFRNKENITLEFSVRKEFPTLREAQRYLALHFTSLPKAGQCQIVCGTVADSQTVLIDDAVLVATPLGIFNGIEVVHRYSISGSIAYNQPGRIKTEGDDFILTESGDKIQTES